MRAVKLSCNCFGTGWIVQSKESGHSQFAQVLGAFGIPPWHLQNRFEYPGLRARYLRKEFDVPADAVRAAVYFSGLGLSQLWINGRRVGSDELSPAATDYSKRVFYRTFDVTEFLRPGTNAVACLLGNGRFFAPRNQVPIRMETYGCPKLRLQLEWHRTGGTREQVVSGSDWQLSTEGAIGWNNEFDGEFYDARREYPAWTLPGYSAGSDWSAPEMVAAPPGVLCSQPCEPIRVTERIAPIEIRETRYGTRIVDFGQNLVGRCRLKMRGAEGAEVAIRHAEELDSPDSLALDNLRSALCTDHVTFRDGITDYTPAFTYHGFRYAEVRGDAELLEIEAEFLHDDVRPTGHFRCSDGNVNRIVDAARRGIRGNYRSFPTDCPQRDERMGWLGDRAMGASGEMFLFDVQAFYRKWVRDILDAQSEGGCVPDIAPAYWRSYSDNVTWPSCITFVPHFLHLHYGDQEIVREALPGVERWLRRMCEYLEDDLMGRDIYGDWCVPPEARHLIHSEAPDRRTNKVFLSSTYLVRNLEIGEEFARMAGRPELAAAWRERRARVVAAINRRFFDERTSQFDNGTQTSSLVPLAFGIVPEGHEDRVFERFVRKLTESGEPVLATGLIGIQWLMRTLTARGRADLAAALLRRKAYPSWGHMMRKGATTIWELWNGDTAEPLMNSGNHVMLLGDLIPWIFQDVAGIRASGPGFSRVALRPHFVFDEVECWHDSVRGRISSSWTLAGGAGAWRIEVPCGTDADIELPARVAPSLKIDGEFPGLEEFSTPSGAMVRARVGSGPHSVDLSSALLTCPGPRLPA